MNKIDTKKLDLLIAQYIDGEMDNQKKQEIEYLLNEDMLLRKRVEELKNLRTLLANKKKLSVNVGFWTRLSVRLEKKQNAHPLYRRKFVPAFVVLAIIGVGLYVLQTRYKIYKPSSSQNLSSQTKNEKGYTNRTLLPVFSKVDKDKALQFSLFGTIPLDEESETSLRVDDQHEKGYRIEVSKGSKNKIKQVTFKKFMEEVKPTQDQKRIIDSLLELTGKHIESSVLIGDDNIMAIAPGLPRLTKIMQTNLESCLEPHQRMRVEGLLRSTDIRRRPKPQESFEKEKKNYLQDVPEYSGDRHFFIITPETLMYSQLNIDFDSLQKQMEKDINMIRMMRERMLKRMMQRDYRYSQKQITSPWNIQVSSGEKFISIEIIPEDTNSGREKIQTITGTENNK